MRRLLLAVLVVVSACAPAVKPGPAASPSASASATATASPGTSSVGFACKLPLANFENSPSNPGGTLQAGFVTFPGAAFALDPNGAFEGPSANGLVKSVAKPYLYGNPGAATFTRRYGRWLPASVAAVSPDSSHYAYGESYNDANGPRSRIHVVDVASAADRVVYDQGFYGVIGYESNGVYLYTAGYADAPNRGLWRLDPLARSLTPIISENLTVDYVGGGAAWYSDLAPGDQPPTSLTNPMARAFFKDRVLRRDLKSGFLSPWFRQLGKQVRAIGVDGLGHPAVAASTPTDAAMSPSEELWLVTSPDLGRLIYAGAGSASPDFAGFGSPLADSHGLWFGSTRGVFLDTPDAKIRRVSTAVGQVAGQCL